TARIEAILGAFELDVGRPAAARARLEAVVPGLVKLLGPDHPTVGPTRIHPAPPLLAEKRAGGAIAACHAGCPARSTRGGGARGGGPRAGDLRPGPARRRCPRRGARARRAGRAGRRRAVDRCADRLDGTLSSRRGARARRRRTGLREGARGTKSRRRAALRSRARRDGTVHRRAALPVDLSCTRTQPPVRNWYGRGSHLHTP